MNIIPFDGKVITQPGIYSGVPIEGKKGYHSNPFLCDGFSISSSGLRHFIDRPSLYWSGSIYNRDRYEDTTTKALNFGQASHHLLLGESGFKERFSLRPDKAPDGRTWNANNLSCREWIADQEAAGRRIITDTEINHIRGIKRSLEAHPAVTNGILNGLVEHTMLARFGSVWLRARPDVVPIHGNDFVDLKTTARIDYDDLSKAIFNNGYHIQAGVVRMVAREVMGDGFEFGSFFFCFVEKSPPYDVRIVELRDVDMDLGEQQVRKALTNLEWCIKNNHWYGHEGPEQSINPIGLPAWAKTRIETELKFGQEQAA